jgi:hypothetical protein
LPAATIASLRRKLTRKTFRRRLDGLRRARENAERLSATLYMLHMFAAVQPTPTGSVDVNAAVRGAVELVRLGYYRSHGDGLSVTLDLPEGLPPCCGSSGLVMSVIIDLLAGGTARRLRVATHHEGEAVVCVIEVEGGDERGYPVGLAAAQLCGGALARFPLPDASRYRLWLPVAEPAAVVRSGSR